MTFCDLFCTLVVLLCSSLLFLFCQQSIYQLDVVAMIYNGGDSLLKVFAFSWDVWDG